jgi:hypothetical protein
LETIQKFQLNFSELFFEGSINQLHLIGQGGNFWENLTGALGIEGTRKLLLNHPGDIAHSRFNFIPNLTTRYFSLGYFFSQQSNMTVNESIDMFEYAYRQD